MEIKQHTNLVKKITKASIKERLIFQDFQDYLPEVSITNISKVEDTDVWDVAFISGTTHYICEIKCRDYKKNKFNDGWILEEKKLIALNKLISTEKAKANNLKAAYLNFFKDGVVIWDVTNLSTDEVTTDEYYINTVNPSAGTRPKRNLKLKNNDAIVIYEWQPDIKKYEHHAEIIYDFMFPTKNERKTLRNSI